MKVRKTNTLLLRWLTGFPLALKETVDWFLKNYKNARIGNVKA